MFKLPVTVKSPAKINLILKITGRRKDGYHNLATLFQMVDLCDTMTFYPLIEPKIEVTCSNGTISKKSNLAFLAAQKLWKPGLPGVRIDIDKKIPVGAGLGGGSSNAATTLYLLNRLWKLRHSPASLRSIGKKLGADVPFFLYAPRAWATGIGDKLTRLPEAEKFYVLLVKPMINIPTAKIYRQIGKLLKNQFRLVRISRRLKKRVSFESTVEMLENDLEETVSDMYPITGKVRGKLRMLGSKGVMLSGSGSTVFALFKSLSEANSVYNKLSGGPWYCAVARTINSMKHLECAKGRE